MATTRKGQDATSIAAFFRERVLPLAARLRAERKGFFPLAPDPQCETYFARPERRTMERADFVRLGGLRPETLEEKLRALWQQRQVPELAALAPELARLAEELSQHDEDGEEISPFVYVMY